MPRTKKQNEAIRAERRQSIIDAALHLFANKGFAATSISDIAQSANISKGLMYNYFKSKEDVLCSIWNNLLDEFVGMIDPNQDGEVTQEEALDFIDKLFEMFANRREEMKLYYQASFQPEVLNYLMHKFDTKKATERQSFVFQYFADRLTFTNPDNARFTVLVFLKGLGMVLTYSELDSQFLESYKQFLKGVVSK